MSRSRLLATAVAIVALLSIAGCRLDQGAGSSAEAPGPSARTPGSSGHVLPDVRGQRLSTAEATLNNAGFHRVKPVDDTGRDRVVIDPTNWVVDSQSPAAGASVATKTTVTLKVRRPSDRGSVTVTKGVVPNVTCMNLQDAQDTLQRAEFFNLASVDGLGQGRHQILDRDWVVTKQSAAPGSRPAALTRIVLTVVKYGEATGTSGCQS